MSRRALLVVVALLVATAACEVQAEVDIQVADDGSGVVAVGVGLDTDATSRYPGLESGLRLDDLVAAGWEVVGPQVEDDGHTWIRATKPFADPAGAAAVVAEIAGPDGPLRDFALSEDRAFARTTYELTGTVDLRDGLEAFADDELAALLDGEPLGESIEEIEARIGSPIDEAFTLELRVGLPGSAGGSTAAEREEGRFVWRPGFADAEPTTVQATGELRRPDTLAFTAVAVVAGLGVVWVGLVSPVLSWRRRRSVRPRGRHGSDW